MSRGCVKDPSWCVRDHFENLAYLNITDEVPLHSTSPRFAEEHPREIDGPNHGGTFDPVWLGSVMCESSFGNKHHNCESK